MDKYIHIPDHKLVWKGIETAMLNISPVAFRPLRKSTAWRVAASCQARGGEAETIQDFYPMTFGTSVFIHILFFFRYAKLDCKFFLL